MAVIFIGSVLLKMNNYIKLIMVNKKSFQAGVYLGLLTILYHYYSNHSSRIQIA